MARRASKISQLCAFVCLCASISAWSSEYHGQVFFGGVPVPGATVTVQKGDEQFSTVTDRQGLYEFADLADGQWKIEIEMSGFSKLDGKVTVTVQKGDEQFSTVTDRQGLYEFADLADGQWKIEIEMSGFSKLDGKVTVTPDAPQGNWE